MYIKHVIFQSTRPSRASTVQCDTRYDRPMISIHKALAGLDLYPFLMSISSPISIHKALAGLDSKFNPFSSVLRFQSTRPSRASTTCMVIRIPQPKFQSTRPSRASTRSRSPAGKAYEISIHKALAGLDATLFVALKYRNLFQSTRPSRASTRLPWGKKIGHDISIHKALAGLDADG